MDVHVGEHIESDKRRPGRKPGSPKVAGSGRKPGSKNRLSADLKALILERGRPVELLCDIARGMKIRVGPQAGPGAEYVYPSLADRVAAARTLLGKILPDMKAQELTGADGSQLFPMPERDYDNDPQARRELAKSILMALGTAGLPARPEPNGKDEPSMDGWSVGANAALAAVAQDIAAKQPAEDGPIEVPIGESGARIILAEVLPDQRERWAIIRPNGQLVTYFIGRDVAEAKSHQWIEEGKL